MRLPISGWCVDSSTSGNPGPSEYKCIDLETKEIIFHKQIGVATNNIAEFIALGHAILEAKKRGKAIDIYSDSITAISWIRKKETTSSLTKNKLTEQAIDFKNRILTKLSSLNISGDTNCLEIDNETGSGITVYKWFTNLWGNIPADFGRK